MTQGQLQSLGASVSLSTWRHGWSRSPDRLSGTFDKAINAEAKGRYVYVSNAEFPTFYATPVFTYGYLAHTLSSNLG
jgi:hypothetical protein